MKSKVNLHNDWEILTLSELCEKMTNGANVRQYEEPIGLPISRIETIWNETIDLTRVKFIRENSVEFIEKYALRENDILFSHINSDLHLGKTAIYKNKTLLIHGINLLLIRLNAKVLPDYIHYQFKYKRKIGEFIRIAQKAVNQSSINQKRLKSLDFIVPPKGVQQAIVFKIEELFSDLDKGIENLRLAQQQLKTYRQSVLKWAFEGKLTEEWRSRVRVPSGPQSISLAAEKQQEYGARSPEGWKKVTIEDVALSLDNKRKPINKVERLKRQGNIPYYGANGQVGWIDDYIFDEPLVCVVEDETFTGRMLPFSYKITGKTWVNNHAHVLKPKEGLDIDFLNYQLFFYPFLKLTTGTTGRKKLTKNALMNAPIKICTLKEQKEIVAFLESRLSVADKMEESINQSLKQAEALKQSILKKAFEGTFL